jgi:hypothetical protein
MVDINLHQVAENDLRINKKSSILKSGSFVAFLLLSVVLVAYGATVLFKNISIDKRDDLTLKRTQEMASFDPSEVNEVVDFQYRLDNIDFNLKNKKAPNDVLEIVEKFIVKGSYLDSYAYDSIKNQIEMTIVLNSFRLGANQILSLKNSGLFSDVKVVESGRNDDEQAVFTLEAYFKN